MAITRAALATTAGLMGCAAALLTGCSASGSASDEATAISYSFVGPSVSPTHHTEYRIDVTDDSATIKVGGYGTVDGDAAPRATETKKIDKNTWKQLVDGLDGLPQSASAPGCTGGSTYKVVASEGDTTSRATAIYACGNANQDAAKLLQEFIKPVSSLFNIDALAK